MSTPPLIRSAITAHTPESLLELLRSAPGAVLLRSAPGYGELGRYSFVTAHPFLTFRSNGASCELVCDGARSVQFGNPWTVLDSLMARYESLDQPDLPFPLGGCFGSWGYDLRIHLEPRLARRATNDLDLPDATLGFHSSLVAFDHLLGLTWIVATGLQPDGSRDPAAAARESDEWLERLQTPIPPAPPGTTSAPHAPPPTPHSSFPRTAFLQAVQQAQRYIRAGDIYQVNLAHRLTAPLTTDGWVFFKSLQSAAAAPFAAWIDVGDFQIASPSPELFLRLSGPTILPRPIKGTRPRSADPTRDAQLAYELQTSPKEAAELIMITDLLRNDLGRVSEFGSVQVPELMRLEQFAHVHHLVSTVTGRLRPKVTHLQALAACFPGGSITGAPKIRAMQIIDELEPVSRGPYTGALGYLGFNRESQLNIAIRTALLKDGRAHFHTGAGIVADSDPAAEYDETLAKAAGFFTAVAQTAIALPSIPRPHSGPPN